MTSNSGQENLGEAQLNDLYRYAMALCRQRDNAYDLLQSALEKYLVAVKSRETVIENPLAYLRTLIRNGYIDRYRYDQRWDSEPFAEGAVYAISPVDPAQICIDQQTLESIWADLSALDRDILYHWAVLGHSTDETCALLAMPRGTLLSRIHRLRNKLQGDRQMQNLEGVR